MPFPHLEVSGTPYECGHAIGKRFAGQIRAGLKRRQAWFEPLRAFMGEDMQGRCEGFLAMATEHFPEIVEELRGWADGSGIAFLDLVALNLKAELGAMRTAKQVECPGCSTIVLKTADRCLLAHNEDGDMAYADLMFLLTVRNPGKPAFTCLSYPGILPGNGPAWNSAGLVLTTNYIASSQWRIGVPRYFLDRAILGASSLDEALTIGLHPKRAFAFHFNLASIHERSVLSVETSVDREKVWPVEGLYVHTNHLLLDGMRDVPQDMHYVNGSSMSRYQVLSAWREQALTRQDNLAGPDLIAALSSHERKPYSPCRHPQGKVRGATLATALFDLSAGTWQLWPGNPCQTSSLELPRPTG